MALHSLCSATNSKANMALDENGYTSETPFSIHPILRETANPGWAKEELGNSRKHQKKNRKRRLTNASHSSKVVNTPYLDSRMRSRQLE